MKLDIPSTFTLNLPFLYTSRSQVSLQKRACEQPKRLSSKGGSTRQTRIPTRTESNSRWKAGCSWTIFINLWHSHWNWSSEFNQSSRKVFISFFQADNVIPWELAHHTKCAKHNSPHTYDQRISFTSEPVRRGSTTSTKFFDHDRPFCGYFITADPNFSTVDQALTSPTFTIFAIEFDRWPYRTSNVGHFLSWESLRLLPTYY